MVFRKTGGIKGLGVTTNLPEEKAMKKGKKAAEKAGAYVEKKIDEANEREKKEEAD